jgi:site-specific recombinase XerD
MQLREMTQKLREWLIHYDYSSHTVKEYQNSLNRIIEFYDGKGVSDYSPDITAKFIQTSSESFERGELYKTTFRNRRKCGILLDEYFNRGTFTWHVLQPIEDMAYKLNFYYAGILREFNIHWSKQGRWGKVMLQTQTSLVKQFLEYLQMVDIQDIRKVNVDTITEYMYHAKLRHPNGVTEVCAAIRFLGDYFTQNKIEAPDFRLITPRTTSRTVLMPAFSDAEVVKLLSAVDRETSIGKRDYAMMMLNAKLGLRASDVANLKFANIDWDKDEAELRLTQNKTDKDIILPVGNDVGNAIADYILYGRPKLDCENIFLTVRPPYRRISGHAVSQCTKRYILKTGLPVAPKSGSHSFRRHFATNMLNAEISYEHICEGLGHSHPANLKSYVRINSPGLAQCALSFADICPMPEVFA